jgi:hypothetical protein
MQAQVTVWLSASVSAPMLGLVSARVSAWESEQVLAQASAPA